MNATKKFIQASLKGLYPDEEIKSFSRWIFEEVCNITPQHQILYKDTHLSVSEKERIHAIIHRLRKMEPLQYILGKTEFYGLKFNVNPSVLIPRPETEELVHIIIQCEKKVGLKILDIGTGSGCIAVTLAKYLPDASVHAMDISEKAISTAKTNTNLNKTAVRYIKADILSETIFETFSGQTYDLIVSNPPYINENEKIDMFDNVLLYELHQALFVPDKDPLIFFRRIAEVGLSLLKKEGKIFFEINAMYGKMIMDMMTEKGYTHLELIHDLEGKNRFIKATL